MKPVPTDLLRLVQDVNLNVDASVVIRQRGLSSLGISIPLPVVHGKVTLKEPVARQGTSVGLGRERSAQRLPTEPENPRMEWVQLNQNSSGGKCE